MILFEESEILHEDKYECKFFLQYHVDPYLPTFRIITDGIMDVPSQVKTFWPERLACAVTELSVHY